MPHEPQPKEHVEPTAGIPAIVDGQELAKAAEDEIAEPDLRQVQQPTVQVGGASSSSCPAPAGGGVSTEASGDQGALEPRAVARPGPQAQKSLERSRGQPRESQ